MPSLASVVGALSRLRPLLMIAATGFVAPPASAFQALPRDRPKVVAVSPADGATDVPSRTEIRVRFDRPMSPATAGLTWRSSDEKAGYRANGPLRYDPEAREFAIPVVLTPGAKYQLIADVPNMGSGNFRSVDGTPGVESSWSFSTAPPGSAPEGTPAPRVVSVDPPPGATVGRLTLVQVVFDRPMDSDSYGLDQGLHQSPAGPSPVVEASYDAPARRFDLLVRPSPDAGWSIELGGFRAADGVPAEPVRLAYKPEDEPFSRALRDRFEAAAGSPRLREVVERAREASRKVESATVRVVTNKVDFPTYALPDGRSPTRGRSVNYSNSVATFRRAPGGKYSVEVGGGVPRPCRFGCDGATCWLDLTNSGLIGLDRDADGNAISVVPIAHASSDVSIADPFDAGGRATASELIRVLKLEYGGEADLNGRRCHEVRSWAVEDGEGRCKRWFLDAETFLTTRVQPSAESTLDFTYEGLNAAIPDEAFRVPAGAPHRIDGTPEGVMSWSVKARDGSDGKMSWSWSPVLGAKEGRRPN